MTREGAGNTIGLSEDDFVCLGEAVLRDIPDAVIYADRRGVIRFWNAGATRIYASGSAIGTATAT